jgi:hypothetical protein
MTYSLFPTPFYIQTVFVGKSPYGYNTITGNIFSDTIYGESSGTLSSGYAGHNTIYGEGGSNTIYGDCYAMTGTFVGGYNTLWADSPSSSDSAATITIYGDAFSMAENSVGGHNSITDSFGTASSIYGNAYEMTDYASGGYNNISGGMSTTDSVYGDAFTINGAGVAGGHNTIHWNDYATSGAAYGDALSIQGYAQVGYNTIWIQDLPGHSSTVFGTASVLAGADVNAGHNAIYTGTVNDSDIIYGDCFKNYGYVNGGYNTINGDGTIYGDAYFNASSGSFIGGHNTIRAGVGNDTVYGDMASNCGFAFGGHNTIYGAGNDTIIGDCQQSTGTFTGGYNTIYASSGGSANVWGGLDGHNTFVMEPGMGFMTINDFDQHRTAFNPAQGDVIDVSAYHLNPVINGPGGVHVITDPNNTNNTIVEAGPYEGSAITLVGVHKTDVTLADFHF